MSVSLKRRIAGLEQARAGRRRIRFVFQEEGETLAQVEAKERAMIASGVADRNDRFVTFRWKYGNPTPSGA